MEKTTSAAAAISTQAGVGEGRRACLVAASALALLLCPALSTRAQVSTRSYLRNTPNEIEREDPRVQQIVARAEEHFRLGELNLKDQKRQAAREEFDKAVDIVLESGIDVRSNPKLQNYYLQLVERVYRFEVPQGAPAGGASYQQVAQNGGLPQTAPVEVGFVEQKFEPSPLDDLRTLALDERGLDLNS